MLVKVIYVDTELVEQLSKASFYPFHKRLLKFWSVFVLSFSKSWVSSLERRMRDKDTANLIIFANNIREPFKNVLAEFVR